MLVITSAFLRTLKQLFISITVAPSYNWRSSSSIRKWQMCVVVMYMVNMIWLTAIRFLDPSVSDQMTGSRGFWWLSSLSIPFLLAFREVRYPSLLPSSLCCPSLYTEPHFQTTPITSIWSPYSITYFSECGMQQSLGFISHSAHIIAPCPLQCNRMASNQYLFESWPCNAAFLPFCPLMNIWSWRIVYSYSLAGLMPACTIYV